MAREELPPPRIDVLRLDGLRAADASELAARAAFEGIRLEGADLGGRDLSAVELAECELVDVAAHETVLRSARFTDVWIIRLDAPVLIASRATWHGVAVGASRVGSADLHESELDGVVIEQSRLGYLNLRGSELRDVLFRDCRFEELDLGEAELTRVAFEGCTADRLTLTHARAQHLDLRGLDPADVAGLDGLRGATVTEGQAAAMIPLFAEHLGLRID
jgi:uncharacterized protein YjbI with pentapeptide repeats